MIKKSALFLCYVSIAFCSAAAFATDTSMNARLDSIEKGMNVLQKYVYNMNTSQFAGTQGISSNENINAEEVGEQFKAMRGDIEKLQQEIGLLNDRLAKFASDVEQRLSDLETPLKERVDNAQVINQVESQLSEIDSNTAGSGAIDAIKDANSPESVFKKAYYLLKDKKYQESKSAFEKFVKDNPTHALLGSAHYWLGEIHMQAQEYNKSAVEYLRGYQVNQIGGRAPDNLLKLAESLFKLGKRQECCVTLSKLEKEFPELSVSLKRGAQDLAREAICK